MRPTLLTLVFSTILATYASGQVPWLYYTSNASGTNQIWRSQLDGSTPEKLTSLPDGAFAPFVLMGGEKVGFRTAGSWPDVSGALWVMEPDGSNQEQWAPAGTLGYRPHYNAGRQELWFSRSSCAEGFKIFDIATKTVRDFIGGPISWSGIIVSGPDPDEAIFVACSCGASSTCNVQRATVVGDELTNITPVTSDSVQDSWVNVSSSGQLVYSKNSGGAVNLFTNDHLGASETQVTFYSSPQGAVTATWSFEDGVIYYVKNDSSSGSSDIRRLDLINSTDVLVHGQDGFIYQIPTAAIVSVPCNPGGALMISASDVPNDQGRQLRLTFEASNFDAPGSPSPVLQYEFFRKIDLVAQMSGTQNAPNGSQVSAKLSGWEFVGSIPAHGETEYSAIVPTLVDENDGGVASWNSEFFVRAATVDPLLFFDSCSAVGMSIDNLAPALPAGFQVHYTASSARMSWEESSADDLAYYRVYRFAWGGSYVNGMSPFATTIEPNFVDSTTNPWAHAYAVSAVDDNGNESVVKTQPDAVTGTAPARTRIIGLLENVPNPFNPSTTISFELSRKVAVVSLRIYDDAGRLVTTLANRAFAEGRHELIWNGRDGAGRRVSSGVYFYRLDAGEERVTRKMVLVQ